MTALELLQHAAPPQLLGGRFVEQIASAQHGVHVAALGHIQNAPHHVQARPRKALLLFELEGREAAAQVPVRGVQQGQGHVAVSD